jgi:hypothetical protein
MGEPSISTIQDAVCAWAGTELLIRRVYLFGSGARNEHRANSDVDLAVTYALDPTLVDHASCSIDAAVLQPRSPRLGPPLEPKNGTNVAPASTA